MLDGSNKEEERTLLGGKRPKELSRAVVLAIFAAGLAAGICVTRLASFRSAPLAATTTMPAVANQIAAPAELAPLNTETWRQTLDLDRVGERLAREHSWDPAHVGEVLTEYRRFLWLVRSHPSEHLVPSRAVDEAWHAHILFTRAYAADCAHLFGWFLHHNPATSSTDSGGQDQYQHASGTYQRTLALYKQEFGIDAPSHMWPDSDPAMCKFGGCDAHCDYAPRPNPIPPSRT